MNTLSSSRPTSRREFLRTTARTVAATAAVGALSRPGYTAENNTIKIALVGCGGRGTGAAGQALSTRGPTQLWALADVFDYKVQGTLNQLQPRFKEQVAVPKERQFVGLQAYKQAIDSLDKGDVVILATAPAFRPIHFEYAVQRGVNAFIEKSFAVDAPGTRRILKAGEAASAKNLKIATGLMSRHSKALEQAVQQIHDGAIGEVITAWAYRMHGPVGYAPKQPGQSELAHQITNYSNFTWLNGSFIVDWLIHNIDVCCWVKNAWPVSVQGMGGRQVRTDNDQLFDHYFAEYTFPDGTRMAAQGRHIANCYDFFGNVVQGTKGCGVLGEGIPNPRLYKGHQQNAEHLLWRYRGEPYDQYQYEHDLFFDAIRNDRPYNEVERSAKSCFAAIMGRMACESGKEITWDEALASNLELASDLDHLTSLDAPPPIQPGPDGRYPVAQPGKTVVL